MGHSSDRQLCLGDSSVALENSLRIAMIHPIFLSFLFPSPRTRPAPFSDGYFSLPATLFLSPFSFTDVSLKKSLAN